MAEIARKALDGFVNIVTNPWDVAAGEVIIKACGGKVTDFEGNNIDYSIYSPTSVVAANENVHEALLRITKKS